MAYISQEDKKQIQEKLDPILKEYGVKGSLRIHDNMKIVLTIRKGKIDFIQNYKENATITTNNQEYVENQIKDNYINVNIYWLSDNFSGKVLEFLEKAKTALMGAGWYNNSDTMTDYFDTAYYYDIKIGSYDKPYIQVK